MEIDLSGRTACISGWIQGVGRAIAAGLAGGAIRVDGGYVDHILR